MNRRASRFTFHVSRFTPGFTLVELLVTVAIIAVLMGILMPTLGAMRAQANKSRASVVIGQLGTATRAYQHEYARLPSPRNASELVLIFNGLRDPITGEITTSAALADQNQRRIQFMEFRPKEIAARTASSSGDVSFKNVALYDPWGTPYGYCFDNGSGGLYWRGAGNTDQTTWPDPVAGDGLVPQPFQISNSARLGGGVAAAAVTLVQRPGGGSASGIQSAFAFFSNGPDLLTGNGDRNKDQRQDYEDDLRSW